jgi:hypothetical protein
LVTGVCLARRASRLLLGADMPITFAARLRLARPLGANTGSDLLSDL